MSRVLSILAVGWAMLWLPALCMGGVISHPCDDHAVPGHDDSPGHPDEPEAPHDPGCSHESDCSADPCSQRVARHERQGGGVDAAELPPAALPGRPSVGPHVDPSVLPSPCGPPPPENEDLPFPPSDIPLLI